MSFSAGDYTFKFEQSGASVVFRVTTITGRDMTENGAKWVFTYLRDMGKWETVIGSALNFAVDLGIPGIKKEIADKYQAEYDAHNYELKFQRLKHELLEGRIELSNQERPLCQDIRFRELQASPCASGSDHGSRKRFLARSRCHYGYHSY